MEVRLRAAAIYENIGFFWVLLCVVQCIFDCAEYFPNAISSIQSDLLCQQGIPAKQTVSVKNES